MAAADPRQAAKVVAFFRVHLRKPLVASLLEMQRVSCPELSVELFISQLVESSVAEFRRVRLPDENKNILTGRRVADPANRRGRNPMFKPEERARMVRLKVEHGLSAVEIAGRFGGISATTVRRVLAEEGEE